MDIWKVLAVTGKCMLCFFNFCVLLLALTMIFLTATSESTMKCLGGNYRTYSVLLMVVACLTVPLCFAGFYASIKDKAWFLLYVYAGVLGGFVIINAIVGILFLLALRNLKYIVGDDLVPLFNKLDDMGRIDKIQSTIRCCGLDSKNFWPQNNREIPKSCCIFEDHCDLERAYRTPCREAAEEELNDVFVTLGLFSICFCAVELFSAFLGFCASYMLKKKREENQSNQSLAPSSRP